MRTIVKYNFNNRRNAKTIMAGLWVFAFLVVTAHAQSQPPVVVQDSIYQKNDVLKNGPFRERSDSLIQKVDSIRHDFNRSMDSLRYQYQQTRKQIDLKIDAIQSRVANSGRRSLDSLASHHPLNNKLALQLDSMKAKRSAIDSTFHRKVSSVKAMTIDKLAKVQWTPGMEGPVKALTEKVNGFDIKSDIFTSIPPLGIQGYELPALERITTRFSDVTGVTGLPALETPIGDLPQITSGLEGLADDVKTIRQGGGLNDLSSIGQTLEQHAGKLEGVQELQKQSGLVDEYTGKVAKMNNLKDLKTEARAMVVKEAVDHFAGKEEQLKSAMAQVTEIKAKYSSVGNIKDVFRRHADSLKKEPFIERFAPGLFLQFQNHNAWLLDVNLYGSYKISSQLVAGLGWNQRFAYTHKSEKRISKGNVFGPRAFVGYGAGRNFFIQIEEELAHTFVPATRKINDDREQRVWMWCTMLGVKKQYKIRGNLTGTVLIQYNILNSHFKTPYTNKLNSRMGFEYTFKQKTKR